MHWFFLIALNWRFLSASEWRFLPGANTDEDEMKRGAYLREYKALLSYLDR